MQKTESEMKRAEGVSESRGRTQTKPFLKLFCFRFVSVSFQLCRQFEVGSRMEKRRGRAVEETGINKQNNACWRAENVHTGVNFIEKAESSATVRFVRITYVRRAVDQAECFSGDGGGSGDAGNGGRTGPSSASVSYHPPSGFSYRTFVPAAVKVGMCSGAPEYESFTATWERSKAWLKCIGSILMLFLVGAVQRHFQLYVLQLGARAHQSWFILFGRGAQCSCKQRILKGCFWNCVTYLLPFRFCKMLNGAFWDRVFFNIVTGRLLRRPVNNFCRQVS